MTKLNTNTFSNDSGLSTVTFQTWSTAQGPLVRVFSCMDESPCVVRDMGVSEAANMVAVLNASGFRSILSIAGA